MSNYIGDIPISAFEEIEIEDSIDIEEIDLLDEEQNLVFLEEEQIPIINIDFSLVKSIHPEKAEIGEQRDDLKSLVSNDASDNFLKRDDYTGFLSVESVSLDEEGEMKNIRQGEIEALFLEWPKHFPEDFPSRILRVSGDVDYSLDTFAISIAGRGTSGELYLFFDLESEISAIISTTGSISYQLSNAGISSLLLSILIELNYKMDVDVESSLQKSIFTEIILEKEIVGISNIIESINGKIEKEFITDADALDGKLIQSKINPIFLISSILHAFRDTVGNVDNSLFIEVLSDLKHSSCGVLIFNFGVDGEPNLEVDASMFTSNFSFILFGESSKIKSSDTFIENSFLVDGKIEIIIGGFGRQFGSSFGGSISIGDYGEGDYGEGDYGEEGYGNGDYGDGIY